MLVKMVANELTDRLPGRFPGVFSNESLFGVLRWGHNIRKNRYISRCPFECLGFLNIVFE